MRLSRWKCWRYVRLASSVVAVLGPAWLLMRHGSISRETFSMVAVIEVVVTVQLLISHVVEKLQQRWPTLRQPPWRWDRAKG